ncbi:rhomboid family intramembrane serine protease [Streptomyces palmae]|uniref:Rhomboid family intramembrane serine protease n=1 Tax=Streptomyces palmae TaxID=1701085 RepID=A0A4Z0HAY2_9ACTN|nr:rhomboid family intramembrane serine protease [Streptomyces palmae]TGB08530.1 rhomboid family intramembrane serine protease [Streptomyces palmae]
MIETPAAPVRPLVTYTLIGGCALVFLLGPASGLDPRYGTGERLRQAQHAYFEHWGVVPYDLWHGAGLAALSPLTALFVHANWLHLLGNMLFLYVFGAMAEERMGRLRFALFYLVTGYLALSGYAAAHAGSTQSLVGASGAISGVLGAFLWLFPRARVTSLFPFLLFLPLRFPAWLVLIFWFALQWLAVGQTRDRPGVAYLAHLVGFTLGFLYAWTRFGGASRRRRAPSLE